MPQENPKKLQERTDRYTNPLQPDNALEYDMVIRIAWLTHAIERGERIETAHLAGRVREAERERTQKPTAQQRKHVRELGRRLLYITKPETDSRPCSLPPWDDDPESLVSELEGSAEGCRWLLERWAEYRNLLDRKSKWEEAELLRFIRLQGKNVIESVYDPALNAIFLAWDVLVQRFAQEGWNLFREDWPKTHPAANHNPQKAPNEAKLESTQNTSSQGVELQNAEPLVRERSQFAAAGQVVGGASDDRVDTIVPAGKGNGKAGDRRSPALRTAILGHAGLLTRALFTRR